MLLVHLVWNNVQFGSFLNNLLGSYTRFAAGGFIFISGLSIGVIFLPRAADPNRRNSAYKALWRRSAYVLCVNYLCAMVLIAMGIIWDWGKRGNFVQTLPLLRDIFLLREGGDLLPFYVIMIAISPLLMQALRRKWGWLAILLSSISVFIWGLWHPWFLAPAQHENFPPILWQAIFILGLLVGYAWPRYNALTNRAKSLLAAASWLLAACLFVMEYSYQWGMPQLSFGVAFVKVPLSTPEALRYLSIIIGIVTTTDVLWPYIAETSASAFVQTLGRKSLPVYALHLWVVKVMGFLAVAWPSMGAWQISMAFFSILILWLFALILDVTSTPKSKHAASPAAFPAIFRPEPMAGAAQ
jgi:hypothetical protein